MNGDQKDRVSEESRSGSNEAACDELAALFASVSDPAAMRRLFSEMFTVSELRDLSLRWRLMKMLDSGITQREIARSLRISLCKITRGSRVVKQPDAVVTRLLRKFASQSSGNAETTNKG